MLEFCVEVEINQYSRKNTIIKGPSIHIISLSKVIWHFFQLKMVKINTMSQIAVSWSNLWRTIYVNHFWESWQEVRSRHLKQTSTPYMVKLTFEHAAIWASVCLSDDWMVWIFPCNSIIARRVSSDNGFGAAAPAGALPPAAAPLLLHLSLCPLVQAFRWQSVLQ